MTFGTYEAKTNFTSLLARAEAGEEVVITRHGKPVARLVPIDALRASGIDDLLAEFRALREETRGRGPESPADLVREGRRL